MTMHLGYLNNDGTVLMRNMPKGKKVYEFTDDEVYKYITDTSSKTTKSFSTPQRASGYNLVYLVKCSKYPEKGLWCKYSGNSFYVISIDGVQPTKDEDGNFYDTVTVEEVLTYKQTANPTSNVNGE